MIRLRSCSYRKCFVLGVVLCIIVMLGLQAISRSRHRTSKESVTTEGQLISRTNWESTTKTPKLLSTPVLQSAWQNAVRPPSKETSQPSNCMPSFDPSKISTPFKFYIYDLPSKFNADIVKCMAGKEHAFCYDLTNCGMGRELYKNQPNQGQSRQNIQGRQLPSSYSISVRDTQQFSLEVIMHYKLLNSKYRTLDPDRADIFYIPAYTGLQCLCKDNTPHKVTELLEELIQHLRTLPAFINGKPHFSTLGKIQREQGSNLCNYLSHLETKNITFIAIEKETNKDWFRILKIYGDSIIVAPYPSYVHFTNARGEVTLHEYNRQNLNLNSSKFVLGTPALEDRNVFLLLAAGTRRSNPFRAKLIDQFPIQTEDSVEEFYRNSSYSQTDQLMLVTQECSQKHRSTTIPWMQKSVFCLQPPGDSPTRKSFYDSILSGCIPVTFSEKNPVIYPFQHKLRYSDFTLQVHTSLITEENKQIIDIIKSVPEEKVKFLHRKLIQVAKWFQYSVTSNDQHVSDDDDAVTMVLDELQTLHNL